MGWFFERNGRLTFRTFRTVTLHLLIAGASFQPLPLSFRLSLKIVIRLASGEPGAKDVYGHILQQVDPGWGSPNHLEICPAMGAGKETPGKYFATNGYAPLAV
jgi:hypothetical protein